MQYFTHILNFDYFVLWFIKCNCSTEPLTRIHKELKWHGNIPYMYELWFLTHKLKLQPSLRVLKLWARSSFLCWTHYINCQLTRVCLPNLITSSYPQRIDFGIVSQFCVDVYIQANIYQDDLQESLSLVFQNCLNHKEHIILIDMEPNSLDLLLYKCIVNKYKH